MFIDASALAIDKVRVELTLLQQFMGLYVFYMRLPLERDWKLSLVGNMTEHQMEQDVNNVTMLLSGTSINGSSLLRGGIQEMVLFDKAPSDQNIFHSLDHFCLFSNFLLCLWLLKITCLRYSFFFLKC